MLSRTCHIPRFMNKILSQLTESEHVVSCNTELLLRIEFRIISWHSDVLTIELFTV